MRGRQLAAVKRLVDPFTYFGTVPHRIDRSSSDPVQDPTREKSSLSPGERPSRANRNPSSNTGKTERPLLAYTARVRLTHATIWQNEAIVRPTSRVAGTAAIRTSHSCIVARQRSGIHGMQAEAEKAS